MQSCTSVTCPVSIRSVARATRAPSLERSSYCPSLAEAEPVVPIRVARKLTAALKLFELQRQQSRQQDKATPTDLRSLIMSVSTVCNIETQHNEMIHDAQLDYYSRKLATASSDRTIEVREECLGYILLLVHVSDLSFHVRCQRRHPAIRSAWAMCILTQHRASLLCNICSCASSSSP